MDLVIDQHARLQIGAEIFGFMISGRHEKNTTILAKWKAFSDESIDIYIQERFNITLNIYLDYLKGHERIFWYISNGTKMHLPLIFGLDIDLWNQKYQIQSYGKLNITRKIVIP
jgi:hypothetical protein